MVIKNEKRDCNELECVYIQRKYNNNAFKEKEHR